MMAHEKRLTECQEKFDDIKIGLDKKSDKVVGWGLLPQIGVSLVIGLVLFVISTMFWGRLGTVEAASKLEDEKIKTERDVFRANYWKTNQDILLVLQDLKKDMSYIKQNMEKKGL